MEETENSANPILKRLDDQKASFNQCSFKTLKISQIVAGALIPFTSSIGAPAYVASALGVLIVVLEGLQSLSQYQHNWISYRATYDQLTHEKYLWLAKAGPYATATNSNALLAERVEANLAGENAGWTTQMAQKTQQQPAGAAN
jgi:hypothetical protein